MLPIIRPLSCQACLNRLDTAPRHHDGGYIAPADSDQTMDSRDLAGADRVRDDVAPCHAAASAGVALCRIGQLLCGGGGHRADSPWDAKALRPDRQQLSPPAGGTSGSAPCGRQLRRRDDRQHPWPMVGTASPDRGGRARYAAGDRNHRRQ